MQINFNSNNNQANPQFKSLLNMKYSHYFYPHLNESHAKAVRAFCENKAIKDFCKKNDVTAEFFTDRNVDGQSWHYLKLMYEKIKEPINGTKLIQKLKEKFFNFQNKYKPVEFNAHSIEFEFFEKDEQSCFSDFISHISKKDLKRKHQECLESELAEFKKNENFDFIYNFSLDEYNKK